MKTLFMILLLNTLISHTHALDCSGNKNCSRCDEQSGNCIECTPGLFGTQCERRCSPNCKYNICILAAGIDVCQEGCKAGYFGRRCSVPCRSPGPGCVKCVSGCQDGYCLDNRGCTSGCDDSYYGANCLDCSPSCKVCDHVSGDCKECNPNYGGPNCSVTCDHCPGSCNRGGCDNGCKPGYYGAFCNHKCDIHCVGGCDKDTGTCNKCQDGWHGVHCKSECSSGCTTKTCTSNGDCLQRCKEGYVGPKCDSKCEDACIKEKCEGETRLNCLDVCKTCRQSCTDDPINCSASCQHMLPSTLCDETTTSTTSQAELTTITTLITETPKKEEESLAVYLVVSVAGLMIMIVSLSVYFSCRFQRIRSMVYGNVRMTPVHVTPPAEHVNQSAPEDAHEYDEVDDSAITIDVSDPVIAEVFGGGEASVSDGGSFPQMVNYSSEQDTSSEGKYLTPQFDPTQRD